MNPLIVYGLLLSLLVAMVSTGQAAGVSAPRPEATLLDLLARPFAPTEGASEECIRDSKIYFAELRQYSPWALQMYDASAKIPPGVITGNIQQLGNFDECLQIKTNHDFGAQACSVSVQFEILKGPRTSSELDMKDLLVQIANASNIPVPDLSVDYEWMYCVPSSCNHSEISEALELALDPLKVDGRLDFAVTVSANSCHTTASSATSFDTADWSYVAVLIVFFAIIAASTAYDLRMNREPGESRSKARRRNLLASFSIYTNGKKLLNTERSANAISCLDGVRYLSICWIIYGHTFYLEAVGVKIDRNHILKLHEDWRSLLVLNGNIVTDTFFLLSGVLLAYTCLSRSSKDTNPSINVLSLYLHRYVRLTPAYAMVIGFYATLFDKLGSGPKWNVWVHSSKMDCRASWWTNLLYINNYVNLANMCMSQSWYLSVDMQLIWLSPIFLYPMLKYNKSAIFWSVTSIGLLVSILIPFCITYFLQLTGTMLYYKNLEDVIKVYLQVYTRVYTRAGPYLIGIALGYILFKTKGYKVKISRIYVFCTWIVAVTAAMSVILGPRAMYFDDHTYSRLEASFYAGMHRHVFTLSVSWVIFACVHGYAGPVNAFLSWGVWVPLSRLTYCAYLSHYLVLLYNSGSVRTASNFTGFSCMHTFFGNLCLTMLISLVISCCFEFPFMTIVRELLERDKSKESGRLATKPSAELIFDSTDSGEGIYRSNEGIGGSKTSSVDTVYTIDKDNTSCVFSIDVESAVADKGDEIKKSQIEAR